MTQQQQQQQDEQAQLFADFNNISRRFRSQSGAVTADRLKEGCTVLDRSGTLQKILKVSPAGKRITAQALHPKTLKPQDAPARLNTKKYRAYTSGIKSGLVSPLFLPLNVYELKTIEEYGKGM